jgi:hypothetical protein
MKTPEQRLEDALLTVAELAKAVSEDATAKDREYGRTPYFIEADLRAAIKEWNAASAALVETQRKAL